LLTIFETAIPAFEYCLQLFVNLNDEYGIAYTTDLMARCYFFIENQKMGGARDNGRTPMQWNASKNAGFTSATPWLKVNENHKNINVELLKKDPYSTLNYFKRTIKLRKKNPALVYGKYTLIDEKNEQIYAYTREFEGKKFLIVLNFSEKNATLNSNIDISQAKIVLRNYSNISKSKTFKPYEAVVFELK